MIISVHKILNFTRFLQKRDIPSDRWADRWRDTPSYREARTHLINRPGPVMVSNTLCPAVHILGIWNIYSWAKGITDHYWPKGDVLSNTEEFPSVCTGFLRGVGVGWGG